MGCGRCNHNEDVLRYRVFNGDEKDVADDLGYFHAQTRHPEIETAGMDEVGQCHENQEDGGVGWLSKLGPPIIIIII